MKTHKKVVILVMSSSINSSYIELEKTIKRTWFNNKINEVEIIFYKDNQGLPNKINEPIFDGLDLYLPCDDGFHTLGQKTIMSFEWVLKNYEFDYIYRSNLGSFIYPFKLLNFLNDKPKKEFYCGIIGKDTHYLGREVEFASGSGYFLSKDIVDIVCSNKHKWNHNAIDDVALGELLSNFNIRVNNSAIRKNICDGKIFYQIGEKEVTHIDDNEIYHIRLRSNNRNEDIENMINIYSK